MFQKLFGNINKYKYIIGTPYTYKFFINKKRFLKKKSNTCADCVFIIDSGEKKEPWQKPRLIHAKSLKIILNPA